MSNSMIIINPFKTVFNTTNWFYDDNSKRFFYSSNDVTIKQVYLHIPFKDNDEYNKRIIDFFYKFMNELVTKIPNKDNKRISYFVQVSPNENKPVTLSLKTNIYSDTWIKIPWERI